jgi:hypothetical protein
MQALSDKLAAIEATGVLAVDLSWLNANYQRGLLHSVRKGSADRLREVARPRRLAALACFLRQSYRDDVDQAVDMFDKLLTQTKTRAEHELDDQMRRQRRAIKAALAALRALGTIVLDETISDTALQPRLFAAVPRDELEAQDSELGEWVTGTKSDVFHGLVRRFGRLWQFTPVLLRALEFLPDAGNEAVLCLEAVRVLKERWSQVSNATDPIAEYFRWCSVVESSSGTSVELPLHVGGLLMADPREVGAFEEVLTQKSVGVLVAPALPGAVG